MKNSVFIILTFILLGVLVILSLSGNSANLIRTPNPIPKPIFSKYPLHKDIVATVFWVGEAPGPDNNFIGNLQSAWDTQWLSHFGGVDTPDKRMGWFPKNFTPGENPFYIALPYYDFENHKRKENATRITWYNPSIPQTVSLVKNRWITIYQEDKVCFAQWEDVGPHETDDFDYVFGSYPPKNTFGVGAGIDISPAVRDCLRVSSISQVSWQFVDDKDVPAGPWKLIITKSLGSSW